MKKALITAAAFGGISLGVGLLLTRKRGGNSRLTSSLHLTPQQQEELLVSRLVEALSHGNKPMWDVVSEACRTLGRGDLPGRVRREWPTLAEQFDRT